MVVAATIANRIAHLFVAHIVPDIAFSCYAIITIFLGLSLIEIAGYVCLRFSKCGSAIDVDSRATQLSEDELPVVCVQLPMFNETAVAARAIGAACKLDWPRDRFSVQVLDDSTDPGVRELVDATASEWRAAGVDCYVLRREMRTGYKAGALEVGRKETAAPYLCLFDADFVPTADFLRRVMPRFFRADGEPHADLALVQAQWSNLNAWDSLLTASQSLWVDNHHVVQMAWRSAAWSFVNFTGTVGVWKASAIERAGGWKAATLVEDCELSFRVLFCGYRTAFMPVPVPAELPASVTAYKAQQRRWTLGWAQLLRIHLGTLLLRYDCAHGTKCVSALKRLHLTYPMCLSVQWPLWCVWQLTTPWLVSSHGLCNDEDEGASCAIFFLPLVINMLCASVIVSVELLDRYDEPLRQLGLPAPLHALLLGMRVVPSAVLSAAMLPHQTCAWVEGLFSQQAEFETTPKNGSVGRADAASARALAANGHPPAFAKGRSAANGSPLASPKVAVAEAPLVAGVLLLSKPASKQPVQKAKVSRGYVLAEAAFIAYHLAFSLYFWLIGRRLGVVWSSMFPALAVAGLCCFYGDHGPPKLTPFSQLWPTSMWSGAMAKFREPLLDTAAV